jgi:hypothetical protein
MATRLTPASFPADRVMRGEYLENLPTDEAEALHFEMRDRSNDEAEETLREESEYWHGMSEVDPEWFFTED